MRPRLHLTPRARLDLEAQVDYFFEVASSEVAERFVLAFQDAANRLQEHPDIGAPRNECPAIHDLRSWKVPGFERHLIFYRLLGEELHIIRLLHGSRDLGPLLEDEPGEA